MTAVRDLVIETELGIQAEKITKQAALGAHLLGHFRASLDNQNVPRVIGGSYIGFGFWIANEAVTQALIAWQCRLWDNAKRQRRRVSLINVAKNISESRQDIERIRIEAHPDWTIEQLGIDRLGTRIDDLCAEISVLAKGELINRLMVFRHEKIAHLVEACDLREKWQFDDEPEPLMFREISDIGEKTLHLLDEISSIVLFVSQNSLQTARLSESYNEHMWKLLPPFSDLERGIV